MSSFPKKARAGRGGKGEAAEGTELARLRRPGRRRTSGGLSQKCGALSMPSSGLPAGVPLVMPQPRVMAFIIDIWEGTQ